MKYLAVFLLIVLLQLTVVDETMAQIRQANPSPTGKKIPPATKKSQKPASPKGKQARTKTQNPSNPTGGRGTSAPVVQKTLALNDLEYLLKVGYENRQNEPFTGYSYMIDGEMIFFPGPKFGFGVFASVAFGGGKYKKGLYNEPAVCFNTGVEAKYRAKTSYYWLKIGYGQNHRDGQSDNGLSATGFSDYLSGELGFNLLGRRLDEEFLMPAINIQVTGRKALKKEKPVWLSNYLLDYRLLPEFVNASLDVSLIDIRSGKFIISWDGLVASRVYDFKDFKAVYDAGCSIKLISSDKGLSDILELGVIRRAGGTGIANVTQYLGFATVNVGYLIIILTNNKSSIKNDGSRR